MVKICNEKFISSRELELQPYFENYSFPLSNFQKYSIEAITQGNHVLVNVPTGSGKTLCGEFAIEHFTKLGKKVIYTCPIKALSNQKYHDFTNQYPHLSIGLLTGDIKTNPDGNVLIMTAEILKNKLFQVNPNTDFDIDINNELGCVVMDEVHYINDKERGRVWEETIMMLPQHVQLVMLSATLDKPDQFAKWVEHKGNYDNIPIKQVYLTPNVKRIVPLKHYFFMTNSNDIYKKMKDKIAEKQIRSLNNQFLLMQDENNKFDCNKKMNEVKKVMEFYKSKNYHAKRSFVINQCIKQLKENGMLPALIFVLSKKNIEIMAREITIPLLDLDVDDVPQTLRRECEKIIRKLPNHKEIFSLDEYQHSIALLEKGIAIHHAGVLPVIREMIEILFGKGYIKILLATETFAVGINMPTKAVVFTSITKFDGNNHRLLQSHEYTQMAGRAGRRGIDTEGHVIHLINLYKNVYYSDYEKVMRDKPQFLESKFKLVYSSLLESVQNKDLNIDDIMNHSLINNEISQTLNDKRHLLEDVEKKIKSIKLDQPNDYETIGKYLELKENEKNAVNSRRKAIQKELKKIDIENKCSEIQIKKYKEMCMHENSKNEIMNEMIRSESYLPDQKKKGLEILLKLDFLDGNTELTEKGMIAIQIKEIDGLVASQLICDKKINELSAIQLVQLFSCFTDIPVPEEEKTITNQFENIHLFNLYNQAQDFINKKLGLETELQLYSNETIPFHCHIQNVCEEWCKATNENECKAIINNLSSSSQIYIGDFSKILIKIVNLCREMEKVSELLENLELKSKLEQVPELILKYVVSTQSLYV